VRFHPFESVIALGIGAPIVVVFGLDPAALLGYELLDIAITLASHANVRVPERVDRWLRYILVTPDLHRVHHSTKPEETDSNFSAVFPVWDWLMGTLTLRPPDPQAPIGLPAVRDARSKNLTWLLSVPFRSHLDPH
jgi:sterol desaturase/sphingolipid hydroxylase (fatty acid hydroxylase superfamily)